MQTESDITEKKALASNYSGDAVYRAQIKLLYQQLPMAMFSALLVAPLFAYIVWDQHNPRLIISWLCLVVLLNLVRSVNVWHFNRYSSEEFNARQWEQYYIAGTIASAFLWGSTCLWLDVNSPAPQQVFQLIIIIGLTGGAASTLTPRIFVYQIFLILTTLPYIARFIYLDTTTYLFIAALIIIYIILMMPTSNRIHRVITESLRLQFKNTELLDSYKYADELNKKANLALFEIMQNNKANELKLEKSESFLRALLVTANDSIITTDKKGIILGINHAIERDFGYTEKEMIGKSINMVMDEDVGLKHDKYMKQYFQSDRPTLVGRMLDVTGKRKDGSFFPMEITVSESIVEGEKYFTGIIRDTTERKKQQDAMESMMIELAQAKRELEEANSQLSNQNRELTTLSQHDALTGLPNRRYLRNTFAQEWPRHQRYKRPIAVVLLDIDFFKKYNDKYGHQAGDECLNIIAQEFTKNIFRPADFIARYGGEEFIAVLPETDMEGAYHIAEKMRQAVTALAIKHEDSDIASHVTISGGVASLTPDSENNSDLLIRQADEALYAAKGSGRNRICQFDEPCPHADRTES